MNPIVRNILAVIVGIILGSVVNMGILILLSSYIIPLPEGVDPASMESMKSSMHLLETRHFITPFLAHALGTLVGAFSTYLIAANNKMKFVWLIGVLFFIDSIINTFLLPAPVWFIVLDLAVAYIPKAWLGGKLAVIIRK